MMILSTHENKTPKSPKPKTMKMSEPFSLK